MGHDAQSSVTVALLVWRAHRSGGLTDLVAGGIENSPLPPVGGLLKTVPYPRGSSAGSNKKPRSGSIFNSEGEKRGVGCGETKTI